MIIYSEVDIKVEEVLYGEPDMDEDGVLVTYELGGRQEISENGRPKIIKVVYDDAAELASGGKGYPLFGRPEQHSWRKVRSLPPA